MNYPILDEKKNLNNTKCTWCAKILCFGKMSIISGGSILIDKESKDGGPDKSLEGFFSLAWHNMDSYEVVDIAKDVKGGQFDIYFCSIECLRAFLNDAIDTLEEKVRGG